MKDNAPSATANVVARNVVLVANMEGRAQFVAPEAARLSRWFVEAFSPQGRSFVKRSSARWFQSFMSAHERITIPGLALHQALRKRHIERAVRAGLAEGFNQLVVLGGGLDTLAVRLSVEFPELNFLELDHPATQRIKREVLESRNLKPRNLTLLPVDFKSEDFRQTLAACSVYQANGKTLFLSEGVLMYLDEAEVERIFDVVRREGGAPKRLVFTFIEPDEKGRASFRNSTWLVRLWLNLRKEPFKWSLQRTEAERFLNARGFTLKELVTPEYFRETYLQACGLENAVLAEGENMCVCDC